MGAVDFAGFEAQILSSALLGGGTAPWTNVLNAPGLSYVTGRKQGLALQVAEDGVTITGLERNYGGSNAITTFGFHFKVITAPTTNAQLIRFIHAAGVHAILRVNTSGQLQAGYSSGAGNQGSTSVTDGAWHHVTGCINATTNPNTFDWTLDGKAQTSTSVAQAGTSIQGQRFGSNLSSHDLTAQYDDFFSTDSSADYPLQDRYIVYGLSPTADGSHSLAGHIADNAGGTTNLYQAVDEAVPDTTTYIKQTVIGASDYAEVLFPDIPEELRLVSTRVFVGALAAGTAANNVHVKVLDGADTQLADASYATNTTTLRYGRIAGLGRDTSKKLNEMKVRIGYSSDVIDVPYVSYLFLEYAVELPRTKLGATSP